MLAGGDLSRRYAHIQYGSKRADVGHRINGMDVSNLWAARGTASYRLPFHGKDYSAGNGAKTNSFGDVTASVQISLLSDGNFTVHSNSYGGGNDATAQVDSGRWAPAGAIPASTKCSSRPATQGLLRSAQAHRHSPHLRHRARQPYPSAFLRHLPCTRASRLR